MISEINHRQTKVLKMDYSRLGTANIHCGGIPVLFPFAGKTKDDEYQHNTKNFSMPMHGFAKDSPFTVVRQNRYSVHLRLRYNSMFLEHYYPYRFILEILYTLKSDELISTIQISNQSPVKMPFNIGFHPYFLTTDKENTLINFNYSDYYDFQNSDDLKKYSLKSKDKFSLATANDKVFFGKTNPQAKLINNKDGYSLIMNTDTSFNVLTLYTVRQNASCIEPWQNLPNCILPVDKWKYLLANKNRKFHYSLKFKF